MKILIYLSCQSMYKQYVYHGQINKKGSGSLEDLENSRRSCRCTVTGGKKKLKRTTSTGPNTNRCYSSDNRVISVGVPMIVFKRNQRVRRRHRRTHVVLTSPAVDLYMCTCAYVYQTGCRPLAHGGRGVVSALSRERHTVREREKSHRKRKITFYKYPARTGDTRRRYRLVCLERSKCAV